jgi:hypothetical protein
MSMLSSTAAIESIVVYSFEDRNILWLALQGAGSGIGGTDGNKKLAMVGDAAMRLSLLDDLVPTGVSRGLSMIRSDATKPDSLG